MKIIKELIFEFYLLIKYKYNHKYNWDWISRHQNLSENFIRKFKDKVDWVQISIYQKLSENFIREFQDKVDWYCISAKQKLSEDFIIEFQDKVDWWRISKNPKIELSQKFLIDLYINYEDRIFNLFKSNKPELIEFCLEVEQQIPKLFLEFDLKPSVELY